MSKNMFGPEEGVLWAWWTSVMKQCWGDNDTGPNLIRMICRSKGWNLIEPGEHMTVHYEGAEYKITRGKK